MVHADRSITIAGPVLGAPQAVLVLEKLIALGDPKALPVLKRERGRRRGLIFKTKSNACMDKELAEAIEQLSAKAP